LAAAGADDDTKGGMGKANVTKFIRVVWRPESIPLKRKMKIGSLDGAIKKLLGSTHSDLEATHKGELTDAAVVELIERITQKTDSVANATGKAAASFMMGGSAVAARSAASDKASAVKKNDGYLDTSNLVGSNKGADVGFADEAGLRAAIAAVRDNADATTWVLAGYADKKTVELISTGTGDVSELLASCRDKSVCYGFFRVVEQIDKTKATKFCFLTWQPDDVPIMLKSVVGTHKAVVLPVFRPFAVDFAVCAREELDHAGVMNRIMELSGTKSMVTDKKATVGTKESPMAGRKFIGGVSAEPPSAVQFSDKDALVAAVKSVRQDDNPTTWAVAAFDVDGKNVVLSLKGSGAGGIAEFREALCRDKTTTAYGLLRVTQTIDKSLTTKFVFVTYQGPDLVPLAKAKISTLRGGVLQVFHPFHVEMFVDAVDEVSEEALSAKLGGMDPLQ